MTTFGMKRMSRCTSRMCRRPVAAWIARRAVASSYWYPSLPRMRWSPPEQNAQPPSFGLGPLPVSSTTPIRGFCRASSSARASWSTVRGPEGVAHLGPVEGDARDAPAGVEVVA